MMADDFDPDAWAQKNGYAAPSAPTSGEPSYEQKIAAVRKKIEDTAKEKPSLPGWAAAPVGAMTSAAPAMLGVGGGVGAMLSGRPFSEGYKQNTQAVNDLLGKHPVAGTLGAVGGAMLSPVTKAIGGLSLPYRAIAGGAMGAAQGAGMATNLKDAAHNAEVGGLTGIGSTFAAEGISRGIKGVGGYLGNARNRLVDYFAGKGSDEIAKNPKLSVLGGNSNAIGAPGPTSVPELQTSEFLRTPEERELARTAAKAVPILSRSRPQAAIVQTMGPEYVDAPIGDLVTKPVSPLYKALNRIGKMGGADVNGSQLQSNIERVMAKKQLGSQSPLSSLFQSATGRDLAESAQEVANTADENLFYSPAAHDVGASDMAQGAKSYLDKVENNLANRHGGGYVQKPQLPTPPGNPNANITAPINMNAPMSSQTVPHSTFLGSGQPSSKINYSQYSPTEAADISGAAERTNTINIGRQVAPLTQLSNMIKPYNSLPQKAGFAGGAAKAYAMATNPAKATISQLLNPSTLEGVSGIAGKVGNGVSAIGRAAGNTKLPLAGTAAINANKFSSYEDPSKVTSDFLSSHMPKEEEMEQ